MTATTDKIRLDEFLFTQATPGVIRYKSLDYPDGLTLAANPDDMHFGCGWGLLDGIIGKDGHWQWDGEGNPRCPDGCILEDLSAWKEGPEPTVHCEYCYHEIPAATAVEVPAADDHDRWAELAGHHMRGCEWIETRAHRIDGSEISA